MVGPLVGAFVVVLVVQRALELRLARRNEAWARGRGAIEFGAGHYPAFFVLHLGWAAGWIAEAMTGDGELPLAWPVFAGLFGLTQALRYWAIRSLGQRWNTRVLVLPGRTPLVVGPYRWLRHPNYVAVALELVAVPLAVGAWWTAGIASLANAALLLGVRIPCEERALRWAGEQSAPAPAEPEAR